MVTVSLMVVSVIRQGIVRATTLFHRPVEVLITNRRAAPVDVDNGELDVNITDSELDVNVTNRQIHGSDAVLVTIAN